MQVYTITQRNDSTLVSVLAGVAADKASAIEEVLYHQPDVVTSAANIREYVNDVTDIRGFSRDSGTQYTFTIRPTTLIQHTPKGGK